MNNRINFYGTLMASVDCENCNMPETIEIGFEQTDWISDYDLDLTIDSRKIKEELIHHGWEEIDGGFVCPDCAEALKSKAHRKRL